jgi:hypothetical protein
MQQLFLKLESYTSIVLDIKVMALFTYINVNAIDILSNHYSLAQSLYIDLE